VNNCYKVFIEEAAKLYADTLVHEMSDISKLVRLYAMINRMRVISARNTDPRFQKFIVSLGPKTADR
jgi:hypothetical protein